jgi:hypothetical protein
MLLAATPADDGRDILDYDEPIAFPEGRPDRGGAEIAAAALAAACMSLFGGIHGRVLECNSGC